MSHSIDDLGFSIKDVQPENGWHCSHFFYCFDRQILKSMSPEEIYNAGQEFQKVFSDCDIQRCQLGVVSGHKADFSLMLMDPDPIKIECVHQKLMACRMGPALTTTFSYVSFTEISEYVLSIETYAERLVRSGEDKDGTAFQKKVSAYEARLEKMNVQRLTPEFPEWPVTCFYPMNKWRVPAANWFSVPFSARNKMMGEHARSGIKFAGKVSQLITVGIGLDDWEWGVTLWAKNPQHLKQIVYDMRFDEASAKYAEFGPFYTTYICDAKKILEVCQLD